jgi:hypothetical protein
MIISILKLKNSVGALYIIFTLLLSACGNIQNVISFSTPYQQPTSGETAKLRVVSFGGMVRAIPNSDCIDWRLPGAGVMVVTRKGFANVNDQNLGMPAGMFPELKTEMEKVAISEFYVPAGKPLVLYYLSHSESVWGQNYQCFVPKVFTPVAGENYEAVYSQQGTACHYKIVHLMQDGGVDESTTIALSNTKFCRVTDNF